MSGADGTEKAFSPRTLTSPAASFRSFSDDVRDFLAHCFDEYRLSWFDLPGAMANVSSCDSAYFAAHIVAVHHCDCWALAPDTFAARVAAQNAMIAATRAASAAMPDEGKKCGQKSVHAAVEVADGTGVARFSGLIRPAYEHAPTVTVWWAIPDSNR